MKIITLYEPIKAAILPKDLHKYPSEIKQRLLDRHSNPPLVATDFDQDQIIRALRQNGWRMVRRKVKGTFRVSLIKDEPL